MTNRVYYIVFSISLLLLITSKSRGQDTLKIVPGISIERFAAYTTNAYHIGGFDLNANAVVAYGKNMISFGPVFGTRRIDFPGHPEWLKSGLNGLGWSYQRELLSGKYIYFKTAYHFIYQSIKHKDENPYEQYEYSNYLVQQTLGYTLGVRLGKHFRFEQHLGAGYGTGKRKIDYFDFAQNPTRKIRSENKGFTMLIKLSFGYYF